jgi:hypothetical protein
MHLTQFDRNPAYCLLNTQLDQVKPRNVIKLISSSQIKVLARPIRDDRPAVFREASDTSGQTL